MTLVSTQCASCAHWRPGWVCAAFPKGIPEDVQNNTRDHRRAVAGDHGVRWTEHPRRALKLGHPLGPLAFSNR